MSLYSTFGASVSFAVSPSLSPEADVGGCWVTCRPNLGPLSVSRISNVDSDLFSKVLGYFFRDQAGGLGEEEIDDCER